jgi:ABC-2 type transport system ATP-binding protein
VNETIFEAKDLNKYYNSTIALKDINMTINLGDIYGFIGENGAGKTTLMKIISGLVKPTSGTISLLGKNNTKEINKMRREIGILLEIPALYPNLNAVENLTFYCYIYGINDKSKIKKVLKMVSLSDVGNKPISEYSLGMRQRLGLAITLLNNPKFLVLDEPINGIDPSGIVEIRKILEDLAKKNGVTILISSHILSELQLLATKIGFIHKGALIKEISSSELLKSEKTNICILTPDSKIASQVINDELKPESITITDTGEIQIPKENTNMEKLMTILIDKGIKIESINISIPNLENYYMDLIGGNNK